MVTCSRPRYDYFFAFGRLTFVTLLLSHYRQNIAFCDRLLSLRRRVGFDKAVCGRCCCRIAYRHSSSFRAFVSRNTDNHTQITTTNNQQLLVQQLRRLDGDTSRRLCLFDRRSLRRRQTVAFTSKFDCRVYVCVCIECFIYGTFRFFLTGGLSCRTNEYNNQSIDDDDGDDGSQTTSQPQMSRFSLASLTVRRIFVVFVFRLACERTIVFYVV